MLRIVVELFVFPFFWGMMCSVCCFLLSLRGLFFGAALLLLGGFFVFCGVFLLLLFLFLFFLFFFVFFFLRRVPDSLFAVRCPSLVVRGL